MILCVTVIVQYVVISNNYLFKVHFLRVEYFIIYSNWLYAYARKLNTLTLKAFSELIIEVTKELQNVYPSGNDKRYESYFCWNQGRKIATLHNFHLKPVYCVYTFIYRVNLSSPPFLSAHFFHANWTFVCWIIKKLRVCYLWTSTMLVN